MTNEVTDENINKEKVFENINKEEKVFETINKEEEVFQSMNNGEGDHIDLKEATKKLRQVAEGSKVIEVPEGEPLFLFSSAVGKTRPINVFYDKGCSHVVFREGVPQHELVSVMIKKGPLTITESKLRINGLAFWIKLMVVSR